MSADLNYLSHLSDKGVEAVFVAFDPATGVVTNVTVHADSQALVEAPQQGAPLVEPFTAIEVEQRLASDGTQLFAASGFGANVAQLFEVHGGALTSAHLAGTVPLSVTTNDPLGMRTATFDFTFQAAGPVTHTATTETDLYYPGGLTAAHSTEFDRPATATGTLTLDHMLYPVLTPLSTADAELHWYNAGSATALSGAGLGSPSGGSPDWIV